MEESEVGNIFLMTSYYAEVMEWVASISEYHEFSYHAFLCASPQMSAETASLVLCIVAKSLSPLGKRDSLFSYLADITPH
jgi:hypothetical protein